MANSLDTYRQEYLANLQAPVAPNGNTGIVPPHLQTPSTQYPTTTVKPPVFNPSVPGVGSYSYDPTTGTVNPPPTGAVNFGGSGPAPTYDPATGAANRPPTGIPNFGSTGQYTYDPTTGRPIPLSTAPNGNTGIVPPHMQTTGGNTPVVNTQNPGNFGPVQTVQQTLDSFINGRYAANARLRGLEHANHRGLLNSNMAAGASERSALESVQPFVQESMGFLNNREDRALRQQLQNDSVLQQDWLNQRQFNNQFNANLSMMPVNSSMQMLQALTQYAMQDPEVYTPEVMSGFTTFFNNNMLTMLKQYFPNSVQGG